MTAEIAVLNKAAIALAADSAITISAGKTQEKIFDTADKLFELSVSDPIGIMIYNGTSFMGIPLPVLVRDFRANCNRFDLISDAGDAFLNYLQDVGADSPASMRTLAITSIAVPILERIVERFQDELWEKASNLDEMDADKFAKIAEETFEKIVGQLENRIKQFDPGQFVNGNIRFDKETTSIIKNAVETECHRFPRDKYPRFVRLIKLILKSSYLSLGRTGIVVAGFGRNEKFPTLISYEIDGMICGKLKFRKCNYYDIDRNGVKAVVLPFAQKEMVDRFLYGLDDQIQIDIEKICKDTVSSISDSIIGALRFANDNDREQLLASARRAERAFIAGLKNAGFQQIVGSAKGEIEDMVEFMPKPELAKMAEALIDLTSIKRRVSSALTQSQDSQVGLVVRFCGRHGPNRLCSRWSGGSCATGRDHQ